MSEGAERTVAVTSTRPNLASHGVDITSWRDNGRFASALAGIFLEGSAAQTLSSPTGGTRGVELWGYVRERWWLVGAINNGDTVEIAGATQGFVQEMNVIGVFERLAVAATASVGTTTARFFPIDQWS